MEKVYLKIHMDLYYKEDFIKKYNNYTHYFEWHILSSEASLTLLRR